MGSRHLTGAPLDAKAFRRRVLTATRPGDVILTGSSGIISTSIQILSRSSVSHAILATAHGEAIEANDYVNRADDRGGGPARLSLTQIVRNADLDFIAVRRPPDLDVAVLQSWARAKLVGTERFATGGLVMMGRVAASNVLRPWRRRNHPDRLRDAEAIADGTATYTCSEFVTRGLLASGVDVDVEYPQFADEYALLPPATPEPVAVLPRLYRDGFERLVTWQHRSAVHRAPPGTRSFRDGDIPDLVDYLVKNFNRFLQTTERRFADPPNGDQADFVTPRDLLVTASLSDLIAFHRVDDDAWHECDLSALRRDLRERLAR